MTGKFRHDRFVALTSAPFPDGSRDFSFALRLPSANTLCVAAAFSSQLRVESTVVVAMCQSLKPGGRIVLVEFRGEDPNVPIRLVHKMTEAQVRKEMSIHPLDWVETIGTLPQQHIIAFRKRF
jgi:hypothetical protein